MDNPLEGIDYPLLREQKLALVELRMKPQQNRLEVIMGQSKKTLDALDGIIGLLDNIQDYATLELGKTAAEIFGDEIPDSP